MAEDMVLTPYSVRDGAELMTMPPVVEETIWGGIPVHQQGATAAFFGPPGSHKSRLVLHLAVHQILGRPFAGMAVYPKPLRWLFLNGENSLARLQRDMSGFARALTPDEIALVGEHLAVTSLETDTDGDLMLDDRDVESGNFYRICEAVARVNPDVLVVDTLPAVCPDELDAKAIRYALGAVRKACASSSNAPVSVIHVGHSRPGIKEEAKATSDPLSYQRGNRVLNGVLRCVWNVRRCEIVSDEPVDAHAAANGLRVGVELIHAKSNNGVLLPPAAIVLNETTFQYEHVANFDHRAWDETLQKMAKANVAQSPAAKAAEAAAALTSTQERVANLLEAQGPMGRTALVQKLIELGVSSSKRNAAETIRWLCDNGQLKMHQPKVNRAAKYYTPKQFKEAVG